MSALPIEPLRPGFTYAERFAIRRLLDCGAVSEAGGDLTRSMYLELVKRGLVDARVLPNGRWLVRLTSMGRDRRTALQRIAA
jgi:hypothetical protein